MMMKRHAIVVLSAGILAAIASPARAQNWGGDAPRDGVCFYEHPNFGGQYFCESVGTNRDVPRDANDRISSIRIFGNASVTVFQDTDFRNASMRAQLRVSPYRARLEICLAPGSGRRYPNLSDHRKNVEYDVGRVLSTIADESFVCGRLRMREEWVVVPFRFRARLKQRGVRCISSL